MSGLKIIGNSGQETLVEQSAIETLAGALRGAFAAPGGDGYDEARTIWNAMIDRRPGAVVRCAGAADVIRAVNFARDHDLLVSVRGGGHNIAGNAVCEGGLMIDLSPMKSVRVDQESRSARVEPGVTLGELDNETQAFGLATPVGINSTTGVAGLTLGGGFGWISRKYGMTIDNLSSADVVTADGTLRRVSESENSDLFWAIQGGGGNFGIVTSFEFRLHSVGPEVLSGLVFHPQSKAPELMPKWRRFVAEAPDELTCWVVLRKAPPLPFLPEDVHGTDVMIFAACYVGDMAEGERVLAPLRGYGEPIADVIGPHEFTDWQAAFDPLLTPGARNYWKSHDFTEINDAAADVILNYAGRLPSPECEIFIGHLGAAVNRVAVDATAYPHRDSEFILNVHTRWQEAAQDEECVKWARDFFQATEPYATGGVYVNFLTEEETGRIAPGAYGPNYERLAVLKAEYDPTNLFRMNQNIKPNGQ
jgi:FAD/FMN-containing dehydrogenase